MKNKVLIITYYWPPGSGPGVQRWLKFVKYLSDFGWNATVLTVQNGSYPSKDSSLEEEIPFGVEVHKTFALEPFRIFNLLTGKKGNDSPVGMGDMHKSKSTFTKVGLWIRANYFIPDARMGWNSFAYKKATELLSSNEFNVVITTGPPHSTHLIGEKLQQRFNIKWIADFRDPWTTIYYNDKLPRTRKSNQKDKTLETRVLNNADTVLTVSPGLADELSVESKRVEVLYNGFDEDDYSLVAKGVTTFDLCYIGNYKENQNVEALWDSVAELIQEDVEFANDFRLKLTGNVTPSIKSILSEKLPNHFYSYPFVKHKEAVRLMKEAGMLLFIIPKAERNHLILTGKIFEYLASGTPMLSIGPVAGNASAIVHTCEQASMISYDNKHEIKAALSKGYKDWKNGVKRTVSKHVQEYSRKGQTKRLAEILNSLEK